MAILNRYPGGGVRRHRQEADAEGDLHQRHRRKPRRGKGAGAGSQEGNELTVSVAEKTQEAPSAGAAIPTRKGDVPGGSGGAEPVTALSAIKLDVPDGAF